LTINGLCGIIHHTLRKQGKKMIQAEKNDVIRSYDFKPMYGRPDCFVEGSVIELTNEPGYAAIKIRVLVDEFDGRRFEERGYGSRVGEIVFVPQMVSFGEYPGRVMNLTRF